MSKTILIIGGGPAGLEAAKGASDLGHPVVLVEKESILGGNPIQSGYAAMTPDMRDAETAMMEMINPVVADENIKVHFSTTVTSVSGELGNFQASLSNGESVSAGAIIVATGFQHFDPNKANQHWGYYEYDNVVTLADAERMLKEKKFLKADGSEPERVAFIQCVGSRDRQLGNQWCSKVCCGIACKQAIEIRQMFPKTRVFIFYIDLRAYGLWEDDLYWKAQEEYNVNFIKGVATEVIQRGDKLVVKGEDTTMGIPMEVPMDIVVLSVGMEPSEGTIDTANMLKLPLEHHGWISTTGGPLNTVSTERPGVFAVGASVGPADLEDTVSSAGSAVMKASIALRKLSIAV